MPSTSKRAPRFEIAPRLPAALERELPWHRRVLRTSAGGVHFVDEGAGPPVLMVHGNPTWSFLWRKVCARLVPAGLRIVVPDLLGFGASDKPRVVSSYSLAMEIGAIVELVDALELQNMILVGQDWGGPVAAGVAMARPHLMRGFVLGNTSVLPPARPFRPKALHHLSHAPLVSDLAFRGLGLPQHLLGRVQGSMAALDPVAKSAYLWPLRRPWERAGPLALARMVPTSEHHPSTPLLDSIGAFVTSYRGPVELVWGSADPILGRALGRHQRALPQARVTETSAGHFLQEQVPDQLANAIFRLCAE